MPGLKALTFIHAPVTGADRIDEGDVLRSEAKASVLGHRDMAPSTLGTFPRAVTFGHVRRVDGIAEELLARGVSTKGRSDCCPDDHRHRIDDLRDLGYAKHGAGCGHTKGLGQQPIVANRADTGKVLHIRHRKGPANTGRERSTSFDSWSAGHAGRGSPASSACGPTPALGPNTWWRPVETAGSAPPSRSAKTRR